MKVFFFLMSFVFAEDWAAIQYSQSHEELVQSEGEIILKSHIDTRCQKERKENLFPENCILYLEQSLHHPVNKEYFLKIRRNIDQLCQQQVRQVRDKHKINLWLEKDFLLPPCKKALKQQKEDLIYIEERG